MSEQSRFKRAERIRIEDSFDYGDVVRRRIEDCGKAAGNPVLFQATVQALENLLPKTDLDDEYKEDLKNCETWYRRWVYKFCCGHALGTPETPAVSNHPDDWLIYNPKDPSDPVSPILSPPFSVTDWHARFRAAFNLLVRLDVAVRRPISA